MTTPPARRVAAPGATFTSAISIDLRQMAAGLLAFVAASYPALGQDIAGFAPADISTRSVGFARLDADQQSFGRLEYRGGLVLTSADRDFGGLSGLEISKDGQRFLAVSDAGHLYSGRIDYRDGRIAGLSDTAKATLKGSKGQPLPGEGKIWSDAEGMTFGPGGFDGPLWVSFERRHRIEAYDFGALGANAPAVRTRIPAGLGRLPSNGGVEALAKFPPGTRNAGALLLFGERARGDGNYPGYILGGDGEGALRLDDRGGYTLADAAFLPDGDLIVLERRLGNFIDFSVRLRRIDRSAVRAGARLDGETLFVGGIVFEVDNFEGLAVHATEGGETRITLVSDDNFSPIQRTLLMQFAITD